MLHNFSNKLKMETRPAEVPLSGYPRPQLKRDSFISLNGRWEDGALVPYPLGSSLSGVKPSKEYTYTRHFSVPDGFIKDRLILHFGAVDQTACVYVDEAMAGTHEGGYLPFSFDITDLLKPVSEHTLTVKITDTLSHLYPYGKQKKHPGGMWYTPVTGIWQSVWLESVPVKYIEALEITPRLDSIHVEIYSEAEQFKVSVSREDQPVYSGVYTDSSFDISIPDPALWTPETPNLYQMSIETETDRVETYFGLRTLSIGEVDGRNRILLNGRPYFFHGVLDQGYFPEGIYTPNTEADYEKDILRLKSLGFNTIRKHIKVEPEWFYEACDRLGMIVFQDMVNNGRYSFLRDTVKPTLGSFKSDDTRRRVKDTVKYSFEQHMEQTIAHLYNFPCIAYYTIFNEGWGQFDSDVMFDIVKTMDPSRIVDTTSGWFKQESSDVESIHCYFKKFTMPYSDRPVILSEFGGFSLKVKGHVFSRFSNYGYGSIRTVEALTERIEKLYREEIIPAIPQGLCGSIYTQITDVEEETNGFFTYDRKVTKIIPERILELSKELKIQAKE